MAFWGRWFKRKGAGDPTAGQFFNSLVLPYRGQFPRRGTRELFQAYREAPWMRAVVHKIASEMSRATWRLYAASPVSAPKKRFFEPGDRVVGNSRLKRGPKGTRDAVRKDLQASGNLLEITDHPLLDLLSTGNPRMVGPRALQLTQVYLDIKGECFWLLMRNAQGMPVEYYPIPPHWVMDVPNATAKTFKINAFGTSAQAYVEVPATEMIWFSEPDAENPYGRGSGTAESLGDEIDIDENAAKFLHAWFRNFAMPGMLVSLEGATRENLERAKESWLSKYQGSANYAEPHFTSGKMNAVRLDSSFREQQLVELRKSERDIVQQVFGVPPECLGILENSNRATIDSAYYIFNQSVIMPRLEFLREELQCRLVPQFDDRICLEFDSPVPEDKEFTLEVAKSAPWAFNLNEWRAMADHDPLEGGDEVFPPLAQPGQDPASANDASGKEDDGEDEKDDPNQKVFSAFRKRRAF